MPSSPRGPSSTGARIISNSGNSDSGHPLTIVHGTHTVHTGNHRTVPTLGIRPDESGPEAIERRIDEIAEVTLLVISPFGFDNFVSGARAREAEVEGENSYRTSEVVRPSSHSPNVIQT